MKAQQISTMDVRGLKVAIFVSSAGQFSAVVQGDEYTAESVKALRVKLLDAHKRKNIVIDVPFDHLVGEASERDRWGDPKPGSSTLWKWRRGHVVGVDARRDYKLVTYEDDPKGERERLGEYGRQSDNAEDFDGHEDEHIFAPMSQADRAETLSLLSQLYDLQKKLLAIGARYAIDLDEEVRLAAEAVNDREPEPARPRQKRSRAPLVPPEPPAAQD